MPDNEFAARIRRDEIDILVDLAGHTAGNRMTAFAVRLAPVQVSYIGYGSTTGLAHMDYRIVDAETNPVDEPSWHTEELARLRRLRDYRPGNKPYPTELTTPKASTEN